MKLIQQSHEILDPIDGLAILKKIEKIGRVCYKSDDRITNDSCYSFVWNLIKRKHEAILEHVSITVRFRTNRRVSHEIVRHRLCSFAQESQRYVDYEGQEMEFIDLRPHMKYDSSKDFWEGVCADTENAYLALRGVHDEEPEPPQIAGGVLSNDVATTVIVTANLRQWRHVLNLRAVGTTGAPHPQMRELMLPLLDEFKKRIPVIFEDLTV